MIDKDTATDIALCYREIEVAEELLAKVEEQLKSNPADQDIRDAFGRRTNGLQLGIPSGHSSHRLMDVPWSLAKPVIEAHICAKRNQLSALNEKARIMSRGEVN